MRIVVTSVLSLACAAACQPERDVVPEASRDVLRVSTHYGLEPMNPLVQASMSRHLLDLIYPVQLGAHVKDIQRDGRDLTLLVRDDSTLDAREIAAAFRHPQLVAAKAAANRVSVTLSTDGAAQSVGLESYLLELGPFRPGPYVDGRLLLERRTPGPGVQVIEVIDMASEDLEWRRLMAGEVDLMPIAMMSALSTLKEVPDLRVVPLAQPARVSLLFRVDGGPTADLRVREAISRALRRGPMSEIAIGESSFAFAMPEDVAEARKVLGSMPRLRLRLILPGALDDLQRVGLVIQQQLAAVDIEVELESVENDQFTERARTRDFELLLFFSSLEPRYFYQFVGTPPGNLTGYASAAFEQAVGESRLEDATAVLTRDLPVTPLFYMREAAVVSRRFCNVKPIVSYDLSWLADVRPCAPGEVE